MKKKLHLIVLVFLCAFNSLFAQLNGTYTINPSGSGTKNFTTFKAAAKMLKDSGVNGAVVFSIANGIYNERVSIDTIKGTSKTNTVTFESASGDSSKVILDYGAGATADLYTLRLNGCSYINFNKITVQKSGGTNNYGIEVTGSAHHNKVSNCIVKAAKTASLCYVIYSATGIDSVNTFYNNYILNGYYKIYWDGGKKSEKKNEFIHNILDSSTYYGVYFNYQVRMKFDGNIVKNNASRVGHCVYLKNIGDTNSVAGNNIISNNNLSGLSIYNPYSMPGAIFIMNNMISGTISSSKYGLVDVSYDRNINFYFNSINLLDNGISSCATKFVYGNCRIFNNIFVNQNKSGYNVYYYASVKADNNDFYYQCPYLGWYAGTDYATFKDWKSGSKCDGGGNNLDPKFKSTSDLHVLNSGLNNKGRGIKYTGIIPTDFDGDPRSTTTPDIGADEFTPKYNDVGVDSILSPSGIECGDSQTLVTVRVTNYGTASQSKIPVSFAINGKVVRTDTLAGPLNPGVDSALTFKYKWNTYTGGAYLISAFTSLTIDSNKINDTVQRVVDFNVPSSIKFTKGVKACAMGNYKLYSAATSIHDTIYWYDSAGVVLGIGDTFTTPVLKKPTTYYAEANAKNYNISITKYTSGNQNIIKTFTVGSTFNALSDLYLNSVLVHEVGTGYVVINIHNRAGSLVASKSTYVVGYSGGALKSVIIPLGFSIPKDSGYIMDASGSTVFGMYMVSPSSYPYIIPNIIKLTGNTLSTKEVYYFYNWNVSTHQSCPSKRVAVKADIEGIKADYFSRPNCNSKSVSFDDISTYGVGKFSSRKWDFGDGTSDTSVSPFHVYPAATLYQAKLIINSKSGCKDSVIYPLSFYPAPKPNFSFTDECIKNANTFVDSTKGLSSRLWRLGDGATDTSKYQSHIYSKPGVYNVSLLGTITNGCSDSTTKSAKVFGYPSAKFTSTILSGGSYKFTPDVSGYSVYKWNFGDGIGKSNLQNPTYKFPTSGSYTVKLFVDSAGNGCTDSDSTTIVVTSIHSESNNFNFSIYPNPFSESTNIHYSLTQKKHIKIYITDVLGRTICTLADANQNAGEYNIDVLRFENVGHLNMNQGGVYFVHFNVGDECIVTRIVMVK